MESKKYKQKKSAKEMSPKVEEMEVKKSKKKSKKQRTEDINSDQEIGASYENNNDIKIKKSKKSNYEQDDPTKVEDKIKKEDILTEQGTIDWPEKDLIELFRKIEMAIPEKDNLVYSTRVEKLNWQQIAFNQYTADDCKKIWLLVQKRLRKFRLLNEVLTDAKEWISKPWTDFYKGAKNKKHPDMPRRPLSSYMLYYMKKKNKVQVENPNLEMTDVSKKIAEMYKALVPSKREKYDKLAIEKRKEYEEKVEEFHRLHPEIPRTMEKSSTSKAHNEAGIKKPSTPFSLFYTAQLKKEGDIDKGSMKEKCKAQWKGMSDKKKVVWIDWALDAEAKYQDEVKHYLSQHPTYVPSPQKPILTKEEKSLKERVAGKPTKPPMSAYSLFSRMMLQSDEIKRVSVKDRMNYIAVQWKSCTEDEKRIYREKVAHMLEQYKLDYATYLESLPEEKREEELQNNLPKRKAKKSDTDETQLKKKKPNDNVFKNEPEKPPKTPFLLFAKTYKGKKTAEEAWNATEKEEQKRFEGELEIQKKQYLIEFKKFLESLNKKQLKEFANMRKNQKHSDNEETADNEEESDEDESSECTSDEEESS